MSPARLAFAAALAALLALPGAVAQDLGRLEASSLEAASVHLEGPASVLDLTGMGLAQGAIQVRLSARDLYLENEYANSTFLGVATAPDLEGAGNGHHAYGAGNLAAFNLAGAPRILLLPFDGPVRLAADVAGSTATAGASIESMPNHVAGGLHETVRADGSGLTAWAVRDGTLTLDGSFLLVAWGWDLTAGNASVQQAFPTGQRLTPLQPMVPDAGSRQFQQQVYAYATDAHLEVDLGEDAPVTAFLGPAAASWTGTAQLADVRGPVPEAPGVEVLGSTVSLGAGHLTASDPLEGRLVVDLSSGSPSAPHAVAGVALPGGPSTSFAALALVGLAILVPGASLPWLRRLHGRRLAEAELALEEGRLEAAAEGARRLSRSRWFAVDAAVLGAEACLQGGDARQALAFLDGRPWKRSAQGLRLLLRARAQALMGEMAAAGTALTLALDQAPDLRAMAGRDPLLQGLLDRNPEGYT